MPQATDRSRSIVGANVLYALWRTVFRTDARAVRQAQKIAAELDRTQSKNRRTASLQCYGEVSRL